MGQNQSAIIETENNVDQTVIVEDPVVDIQHDTNVDQNIKVPVDKSTYVHPSIVITDHDNDQNKNISKKSRYVHPFIEIINRGASEAEIINLLQAFCGKTEVGPDDQGNPTFEFVDQTEFIAPMLQLFSHCANNGKKTAVQWIITNFVPLCVSYDNNYCYFECLRWKHYEILDMIIGHESFDPTKQVLENILSRNKYDNFRTCMDSPRLSGLYRTYKFTFIHYITNSEFAKVIDLFNLINQKESGQDVEITDQIYPNPKLVQKPIEVIAEQVIQVVTEPTESFNEPVIEEPVEYFDEPVVGGSAELTQCFDEPVVEESAEPVESKADPKSNSLRISID